MEITTKTVDKARRIGQIAERIHELDHFIQSRLVTFRLTGYSINGGLEREFSLTAEEAIKIASDQKMRLSKELVELMKSETNANRS